MVAAGTVPPSPPLSSLSDSDLSSLLSPITHHPGSVSSVFQNWATTFRSQTQATFTPRSVDQVRWIVELARRLGKELRAAGAGHSPSDIVCTGGYVIDLKGLDRVIQIDEESKTFHAEGGIILRNLHPQLAESNLALSSLGSISDQTLAGAISTSTHGSGVTFGSLSTYVTFLDIVLPLPDAPIVRVSREEDSDLFMSALCGLGVVGVIVGVGMRAETNFKLEEECFSMRFDTFQKHWREIAESAEHVRCWWFPQIGRVKVSRMNRTKKAISAKPNALKTWLVERFFATHFHAAALFLSRTFPSILPYHAHLMWNLVHQPGPLRLSELFGRIEWPQPRLQLTEKDESTPLLTIPTTETKNRVLAKPPSDILTPPQTPPTLSPTSSDTVIERSSSPLGSVTSELELPEAASAPIEENEDTTLPWPILEDEPTYRVDTSIGIFNYDCGFPQYTYESSVPYDSTTAALTSLSEWHVRELHNPEGYTLRAHFPIEIRWTEKDDVWLSPCYEQRGTFLGAIQYRPYNLPVAYRSTFNTFASLITLHSGRPHWAKTHTLTPSILAETYPRFRDFMSVRSRVDPENVLVNGYVRRHLLGQDEEGKEVEKEAERWEERSREWKVRKQAVEREVKVPRESVQMVC
ncbi:D-arabinono-1,4-lactone oxidase [Sporobolomyces salmoneus]|uniref:D-arabinono-1,4-lactone oxidase n=1 Tax=Sporobolomyces salmoneus TaxID=183962 RepID=UPI0031794240